MKRILFTLLIVAACCSLASCDNNGPRVTTKGYTMQGNYSVVLSGSVVNDGPKTITEVGFVYSESTPNPTYSDGYKKVCGRSEGEFSATITRSPSYNLYFRAYAKVGSGSVYYGSVWTVYKN